MVFPGAEHSRFGHALGAMALMHDTLTSLAEKGTRISADETEAALAVSLLHDVGHGPFSHTLEHELIADFHHEQMSRALLGRLNERFGGRLALALEMFDGTYERKWFHQLISSQLDMDRLDYLRRDSYYTGVVEGRVGVGRIIKTLRVHPDSGGPDDRVVVEAKGVYAVENFLIARRLMYWQVYLHKTVVAGDHLLRSVVTRVRNHLSHSRTDVVGGASAAFMVFLERRLTSESVADPSVQDQFVALDDTDIIYSLKAWRSSPDPVLADLSRRFLGRDFFRVRFTAPGESTDELEASVRTWLLRSGLSTAEQIEYDLPHYLVRSESDHEAYDAADDAIGVLNSDDEVTEISRMSEASVIGGLGGHQIRPYVCFPKEAEL